MNFITIYKSLDQFNKYNEEFNKNADEISNIKKDLEKIENIKIEKINDIDKELEKHKLYIYKDLIIDYNTKKSFNEYKDVLNKFLININEDYQKKLKKKKENFYKSQSSKIINFKILRENINKYFIENIQFNQEKITENDIYNDIYLTNTIKKFKIKLDDYYENTNSGNTLFLSFKFKQNYIKYINNLISFIQDVINKINQNKDQKILKFNENKGKLENIKKTLGEITSKFYTNEQVGGNEEMNKLKTVNLFLLDLIQEFNKVQQIIIDYNMNLYDIYYFLLFMNNEDINRTYSLFSMKYISKNFIVEYLKYYNKIKNISKFNLIKEIIESYLSKPNMDNIITNNKDKLNFVLLIDKFNTYLRQYINQKEFTYNNISFNLENIFFIGNRELQNLTIYYTGGEININKLIIYFYLSNMYLIKNIKINCKELIKYSNIKNLSLEGDVNILINDIYKYTFTNIEPTIKGKKIIKITFNY